MDKLNSPEKQSHVLSWIAKLRERQKKIMERVNAQKDKIKLRVGRGEAK